MILLIPPPPKKKIIGRPWKKIFEKGKGWNKRKSERKRPKTEFIQVDNYIYPFLLRNLLFCSTNSNPAPCYSYLLPDRGAATKRKTGTVRRSTAPRWESTLAWENVSLGEAAERSLELVVLDQDRLGAHEQLGMVRLNLGTGMNRFPEFRILLTMTDNSN